MERTPEPPTASHSDEDWTPELELVRNAMHADNLHWRAQLLDELFALALSATELDQHRWHHTTAVRHGATASNPVDCSSAWELADVQALAEHERLAWLAAALAEISDAYYGWRSEAPWAVGGHDPQSPGGLIGAVRQMRDAAEQE
jgi:hypothetical protein